MQAGDLEHLACLLDKNRTFERPDGQRTGFSLQERSGAAETLAHNTIASASGDAMTVHPAAISMPSTVVDHQLRLPQPSELKRKVVLQREQQLSRSAAAGPVGNEIWTQAELEKLYEEDHRRPVGLAAMVRPVAGSASGAFWKPAADVPVVEPKYTVMYQQQLSAEDVYLGVDFTRDNSSAASDGVVVRVELPHVSQLAAIGLEVDLYELRLSVRDLYYLVVPLPRKVQRSSANAKWDGVKKMLTVQMMADRTDEDVKLV